MSCSKGTWVNRSRAVFRFRMTGSGSEVGAGLDHCGQMGRSGPATPSDDRDPELAYELAMELGQLLRGQVIVHGAVHHRRKSGVGQA